jgi:enoyl-CoA hydratase
MKPLEHIRLDVRDHVATVALDRAPVNALNRALRGEIVATFDALHDRDDVRAIVLASNARVFCAGADIKERSEMTGEPGENNALNRLVRSLFYSILECRKPVIAAVDGAALGAGFALALVSDVIVASESAVFGMPEVDVGLAGGVKYLERHFTPGMARLLLLTGRRISGAELHRLGVAASCVPSGRALAEAQALAHEIAGKSPLAVQMLKHSFNVVENLSLRDGYRIEQEMTVQLSSSEDAKEAKRAFLEKRKPVFKGR